MPYGNVSGKRQKGLYLSEIACDMLDQLSRIQGKTESAVLADAITEYFFRIKASWEGGNISWENVLRTKHYHLPEWQRSKKD